MRTLTLKDRDVSIAEMDELEIYPRSRWLSASTGKIIVVLNRTLGQDWMPIRIEVLDLAAEEIVEIHPADFARWVQQKKYAKFTPGTWAVLELNEPIPQAS